MTYIDKTTLGISNYLVFVINKLNTYKIFYFSL